MFERLTQGQTAEAGTENHHMSGFASHPFICRPVPAKCKAPSGLTRQGGLGRTAGMISIERGRRCDWPMGCPERQRLFYRG
jgi:hypothetical protein